MQISCIHFNGDAMPVSENFAAQNVAHSGFLKCFDDGATGKSCYVPH